MAEKEVQTLEQLIQQQKALRALRGSPPRVKDPVGFSTGEAIERKLARVEKEIAKRGAAEQVRTSEVRELARLADEARFKYWRSMTLKCFARDTPDFDHFTRIVIEKLEKDHPDVQLWFAGFPITGEIASSVGSELVLSTTFWFRAPSAKEMDAMAADVFVTALARGSKADRPWLAAWADVVDGRHGGTIAFEAGEWESEAELGAPEPAENKSNDDVSVQKDGDLFIAAPDGEMYLMRQADYEPDKPGAWHYPAARYLDKGAGDADTSERVQKLLGRLNRAAETQLAQRMIEGGVELAAIPSTGLPTRGTYCYLVNLAPAIPGAR